MSQIDMKIAFIGVGGIAGNYRRSLKQLERPVAAVCDINAERAASIAADENAISYTDHQEMLQKEKPDVVFTCIPPGAHATQVADAAKSKAAVFVAKPVAQNIETAQNTREVILIFLKSTQKSVSINGLSIRGYENAKKCQLICPQYVKNIPYFQYKIE